ncbi:MAG: hypothetical protein SFV17_10150 [Candidatus Obscuribacter sp.]|nr:hypothetical protein [Candidatus Obscuribacter sp.]
MDRKFHKGLKVFGMLSLLTAALGLQVSNCNTSSLPPLITNHEQVQLSISSLEQKVDERIVPLIVRIYGERGSLLERSVGAAEGTRRPDGSKVLPAYNGHQDPMCHYNFSSSCYAGVTNLGSFSYQQAADKPRAKTAEQADLIQRQVLRLQALELLYQARRRGLELTLFQLLSGIDLANQSPQSACVQQPDKAIVYKLAAGIDPNGVNTKRVTATFSNNPCRWGYIDRLAQAVNKKGLRGLEAIVEARKWTFFEVDPASYRFNKWSAAGLGHNPRIIEADQWRRSKEVESALRYQIENPQMFPH